jgi:hypothetical protein
VNPNNGPGSSGSKPDENFVTCIPQLRPPGGQTLILGYVDTTAPSSGSIEADIDTYAGWDSSYRPTGIFLDQISPTQDLIGTYQSYVSHAKFKGFTFVSIYIPQRCLQSDGIPPTHQTALDPGQAAPSAYFAMADLVNTYEDSYSAFDPSSLSGTLTKQSVTLVNAPSTGSYSSVISNLGAAAVYITDGSDSSSNLPIQLSKFVSEVANAGGSAVRCGRPCTETCVHAAIRLRNQAGLHAHRQEIPLHGPAPLNSTHRRANPKLLVLIIASASGLRALH